MPVSLQRIGSFKSLEPFHRCAALPHRTDFNRQNHHSRASSGARPGGVSTLPRSHYYQVVSPLRILTSLISYLPISYHINNQISLHFITFLSAKRVSAFSNSPPARFVAPNINAKTSSLIRLTQNFPKLFLLRNKGFFSSKYLYIS